MKLLLLIIVLPAVLLMGCSKHDELHESMESMGESFKVMRKSDDIAEVKAEWVNFKQAQLVAQKQKVPAEDQSEFDNGMSEVSPLIDKIDAALNADDLAAAKGLFKQLGEVRKEYHDKLNVDK